MSQSLSTPASFLNLDLELEAFTDLASIAESFGRRVFVLYCGDVGSGFRLSVEPIIDGGLSGDPHACTEYFLDLIEGLQRAHGDLWRSCSARVFDYGFDGGLEENPIQTNIPSHHLARMANLGIEFRITVYPYRASEPESDPDASASTDGRV